jgi:hypothetical protein
MHRLGIGGVVGVVVWLGSLGVAQAQPIPIPPVGPTSVFAGAQELDCTCGVSATRGFFSKALGWYNGQGGVTFSLTIYYAASSTSVDNPIPTENWPMLAGDSIAILVQFSYSMNFFPRAAATGTVSIVQPTSMNPTKKWGIEVEAADRDRREWA